MKGLKLLTQARTIRQYPDTTYGADSTKQVHSKLWSKTQSAVWQAIGYEARLVIIRDTGNWWR